jgi:hypothetical protein
MRLDIPKDLPGHSFIDQLVWLENWAHLPKGQLCDHAEELLAAESKNGMVPVIIKNMDGIPWDWPAYDVYVQKYGFVFSKKLLKDKAEHIYDKYRSNKLAIHRKAQIGELIHLRHHWELTGRCASKTGEDESASIVRLATDKYWSTHCVPWNCEQLDCRCQVHALSEFEYRNR